MRRLKIIIYLLFVVAIFSCNKKFEKSGWNYSGPDLGDPIEFPNRDMMLNDLLENHKIKGLTVHEVYNLLGKTEVIDNKMTYIIFVDYGFDIDPVHTKYLEIVFNNNGLVETVEIIEWRK